MTASDDTGDDDTGDTVRKRLAYARWVWLVGSGVLVVSAVGAAAVTDGSGARKLGSIVGVTILVAIAVPAALALRRRANWARITLLVLSSLSIIGAGQSVALGDWPSVVIDLILASPVGVLATKDVRAACTSHSARADTPAPRRG